MILRHHERSGFWTLGETLGCIVLILAAWLGLVLMWLAAVFGNWCQ